MNRNQPGQKIVVYAKNITTGDPAEGEAGNITAELSLDGGGLAATNDTNPTEIGKGLYAFDATQAETDGAVISVAGVCSTPDVQVEPRVIETSQDANVTEVNGAAANPAGSIDANVTAVNGNSTAASNLESYNTGSGFQPVNVTRVAGDATAALNLSALMTATRTGTASGTVTATGCQGSSLTGLGDSAIVGAVVVFTDGNASHEPRRITAYTSSSGELGWTPAMSQSPTAGDPFVVTGYIEAS